MHWTGKHPVWLCYFRFVTCKSMMLFSRLTTSKRCSTGLWSNGHVGHLDTLSSVSRWRRKKNSLGFVTWHIIVLEADGNTWVTKEHGQQRYSGRCLDDTNLGLTSSEVQKYPTHYYSSTTSLYQLYQPTNDDRVQITFILSCCQILNLPFKFRLIFCYLLSSNFGKLAFSLSFIFLADRCGVRWGLLLL